MFSKIALRHWGCHIYQDKGAENKTPAINFNKLKIVLEKVKICASFKKSHTELHAVSVKQYFVLNYKHNKEKSN